jgi:hypothetical protein
MDDKERIRAHILSLCPEEITLGGRTVRSCMGGIIRDPTRSRYNPNARELCCAFDWLGPDRCDSDALKFWAFAATEILYRKLEKISIVNHLLYMAPPLDRKRLAIIRDFAAILEKSDKSRKLIGYRNETTYTRTMDIFATNLIGGPDNVFWDRLFWEREYMCQLCRWYGNCIYIGHCGCLRNAKRGTP